MNETFHYTALLFWLDKHTRDSYLFVSPLHRPSQGECLSAFFATGDELKTAAALIQVQLTIETKL